MCILIKFSREEKHICPSNQLAILKFCICATCLNNIVIERFYHERDRLLEIGQIKFRTESSIQCVSKKFCVLGARVDDIAVMTVQCDAQQLFLAMTGSRKNEGFYRLH